MIVLCEKCKTGASTTGSDESMDVFIKFHQKHKVKVIFEGEQHES